MRTHPNPKRGDVMMWDRMLGTWEGRIVIVLGEQVLSTSQDWVWVLYGLEKRIAAKKHLTYS